MTQIPQNAEDWPCFTLPMSSHEFPGFTDDLSWCPRTLRSPVEPTRKCLMLQQHVHNTKISLLGKLTWLHMASHGLTWLDHPGPFQEISKSKDDVAEAFWKASTTFDRIHPSSLHVIPMQLSHFKHVHLSPILIYLTALLNSSCW